MFVVFEEVAELIVEDGESVDDGLSAAGFELLDIDDEILAVTVEMLTLEEGVSAAIVALSLGKVEVELCIPRVPSTLLPPSPAVLARKNLFSFFILQQL